MTNRAPGRHTGILLGLIAAIFLVGFYLPTALGIGLVTQSGSKHFASSSSGGGTVSATLSWTAPAKFNDDSTAAIASYNIYVTSSVSTEPFSVVNVSGAATSYQFIGLDPGTYHFTIKAVAASGVESAMSEYVSKVVP
jgi:hypothetical protein